MIRWYMTAATINLSSMWASRFDPEAMAWQLAIIGISAILLLLKTLRHAEQAAQRRLRAIFEAELASRRADRRANPVHTPAIERARADHSVIAQTGR